VRAGAEGESRIEFEQDHVGIGPDGLRVGTLATGTHPQSPSEPHRLEVLEPLTFPDAVGNRVELGLPGEQGVETVS
jgi:hypothetical protein